VGLLLAAAAGAVVVYDRSTARPGGVALAATAPEPPTPVTNSVGMAFVPVPAGQFLMGSPADERGREADLEAQRLVTVPQPYYLGATEVTQGQYAEVTKTNPGYFAPLGAGRDAVKDLDWRTLPADSVSWQHAVAFCDRLSDLPDETRAGRRYRLPTEVEWEYACRAGTRTPFHTGPTLSTLDANVHPDPAYDGATNGPYLDRTTPVASYRPNAWGLYDMHGNVMEWVATGVTGFPNRRVIRGMGFHHSAADCRSAFRGNPVAQGSDLTSGTGDRAYGFRVLMSQAPTPPSK
jgi:formylglycine-generating enzyme required for sulfatase activity